MWWLWLLLLASFVLLFLWWIGDKKQYDMGKDLAEPLIKEIANNTGLAEVYNMYAKVKSISSSKEYKDAYNAGNLDEVKTSNIYPSLDEIKLDEIKSSNYPSLDDRQPDNKTSNTKPNNKTSNTKPNKTSNIYPSLDDSKADVKTSNTKHNNTNTSNTKSSKKKRFRTEDKCCKILEDITGKKFERNIRPSFLRNPETGYNCELDCYNAELKLALEYNGKQHYVFPNYWHKTYEEFIAGLRRDKFKSEACEYNNIYLIIVPYTVKHKDLENYIRSRMPGVYESPSRK